MDNLSIKETMSRKEKFFFAICWIGAFLINVKMVFASFNNDSAICAVMSLRMVRGDRLFVEMWEPHQTSSILPAILSNIYLALFKSTEGIVIWLQFCGMVIFAVVALLIVFMLRKHLPVSILNYCALLVFLLRPKFSSMPDYVNMSIAFTTLLWIFLLKYAYERKKGYLIGGSVFACMAALAYPSNVLLFFLIVLIVYFLNNKRGKDCLWVLLTYFSFFGIFVAVVMIRGNLNLSGLLEACINIFGADGHSNFKTSGWGYFSYTVYGIFICAGLAGIAFVIKKMSKKSFLGIYAIVSFALMVVLNLLLPFVQKIYEQTYEWIYINYVVSLSYMVIGFIVYMKSKPGEKEKTAYILGLCISVAVFVNTLILTDLPLASALGYMPLGLTVSIIPLTQYSSNEPKIKCRYIFAICILAFTAFYQLFLCSDSQRRVITLYDIENYVRTGPEKYCISTLQYCNRVKEGLPEWKENVSDKDSVLIIPGYPYELVGYLYSEAKMSNYSATSAPSLYEDKLLLYWEKFPDRKPTVIAVQCWQDDEDRHCPEWLSNYVDENYTCVFSGSRWKIYR